CGKPADIHKNCANDACHILFIQCEECATRFNNCCSNTCKDFIALPEEERRRKRLTTTFNGSEFSKSRKSARKGALKID
ncbi:MAG: hypothetical protein AAFU67_01290, partial [Bacteroidota bacterium]